MCWYRIIRIIDTSIGWYSTLKHRYRIERENIASWQPECGQTCLDRLLAVENMTNIFNKTEEKQEAACTLMSGRCPWKQEPFNNAVIKKTRLKWTWVNIGVPSNLNLKWPGNNLSQCAKAQKYIKSKYDSIARGWRKGHGCKFNFQCCSLTV